MMYAIFFLPKFIWVNDKDKKIVKNICSSPFQKIEPKKVLSKTKFLERKIWLHISICQTQLFGQKVSLKELSNLKSKKKGQFSWWDELFNQEKEKLQVSALALFVG